MCLNPLEYILRRTTAMDKVSSVPKGPPAGPAKGIVRFGAFEVDRRAGELRKGGVKIKLHGQPFQVLEMLLERPDEVVTREELHKRLWSADTFVDFEQGLNNAINLSLIHI